jgi:putative endonuclease
MSFGVTRWPVFRRWFGSRSERAAAKFLRKLGCRILARNVNLSIGELDIVALDRDTLVFVEVRSTQGELLERPTLSIDAVKQKKLTSAALTFLSNRRLLDRPARFDVIIVGWPANRREPHVVHYPNAFEPVGRFQMYN